METWMITLFAWFVSLAVPLVAIVSLIAVAKALTGRAQASPRTSWEQLAAAYQGELRLRGDSEDCYQDHVIFSYRGVEIRLNMHTKASQRFQRMHIEVLQKMTARLPLDPSLWVSIQRDGRLFDAGRPDDVQIYDAAFDQTFLVRSSAPEWLGRALHQAPQLRALHLARHDLEVELRGGVLTVTRAQESHDVQDLEEHLRLTSLYISALTEAVIAREQGR